MRRKRQLQVIIRHPLAVVGDADEILPAPFDREVDGYQSYVTFVSDTDVLDELAALADKAGADEKISRGPDSAGVIYWQVTKNQTLDSTIGKTMGKKRYKSSTTTRNVRTLVKVLR